MSVKPLLLLFSLCNSARSVHFVFTSKDAEQLKDFSKWRFLCPQPQRITSVFKRGLVAAGCHEGDTQEEVHPKQGHFRAMHQEVHAHHTLHFPGSQGWDVSRIKQASRCAGPVAQWVESQLQFADLLNMMEPMRPRVEGLGV